MRTKHVAVLIAFVLAACPAKPTFESHRKHSARDPKTYGGVPKVPLEARLLPMPPVLAEYMVEDNALIGFPSKPKPATLTQEEKALVAQTIATVPEAMKAVAEKHVIGIFFVDDLGSTGFTEFLHGAERASILVFDRSVIMLDANTWAAKKEKTVFDASAPLTFTLRTADDNKPGSALQYILLHELAHVIGHAKRIHPSASSGDFEETPLSKLSWEPIVRPDGEKTFQKKAAFALEQPLGFYGSAPKQDVARAPALYEAVSRGCFASLYAMVQVEDDFAETLAIYAHMKWLKKPYAVAVGATQFETPIFEDRCKTKLAMVLKSLE